MKCPKCHYLGFETGDRCKNCGYDFSLLADADQSPEPGEIDLPLHEPAVDVVGAPDWLARIDQTVAAPPIPQGGESAHAAAGPADLPRRSTDQRASALPLLTLAAAETGDEPLITLPPAPRPPLAVRRTPESQRSRPTPQALREIEPLPALAFDDEVAAPAGRRVRPKARIRASGVWTDSRTAEVSGARARLMAAVVDHLTLSFIDGAVIYFTLRMAGLPMGEWRLLPAAPLLAFLLLVKVSYFSAFTAVGGQTIGKMAARIRVVSADDRPVDAVLALRRTLAGVLSAALLGLGFLPALFGSERRALHDRIARTRVVALPSAVEVGPR